MKDESLARPKPAHYLRVANTLLLSAICALLIWLAFKPTTQWEYHIEAIPDDQFALGINKLGAQGWELVAARRASSGDVNNASSRDFSYEMIFKRQKSAFNFAKPQPDIPWKPGGQ